MAISYSGEKEDGLLFPLIIINVKGRQTKCLIDNEANTHREKGKKWQQGNNLNIVMQHFLLLAINTRRIKWTRCSKYTNFCKSGCEYILFRPYRENLFLKYY